MLNDKIKRRIRVSGIIMLLTLSFFKSSAQVNLVPNYSFEQNIACPDNLMGIINLVDWYNPTLNTPDYFHSCSATLFFDLPTNLEGTQNSVLGNAYTGVYAYISSQPNVREYISAKLTSSLSAHKKYCIDFFVSLSDSSRYAINNLGVFFSKDSLMINTFFQIDSIPQIIFSNLLNDKVNWIHLNAIFIANGGERHITIGNFSNGINTNLFLTDSTLPPISYYFIENVTLKYCDEDTNNLGTVPNIFTPNGDGINDMLEIQGLQKGDKLTIYNRWGTKVFYTINEQAYWDGYTTSGEPCSQGTYFYTIDLINGERKSGYVQLQR